MKLCPIYFVICGGLNFLLGGCASTEVATWDGSPETYQAPPPEVPPAAPEAYFQWPVDTARFVRGFSLNPVGRRHKPHLGMDLAGPRNSPILAAHEGTVIYVGKEFRGFGKMILIEGRHGWASLYAHLNRAKVKEGERVYQGQIIGHMGRTGRASGVHLHFEIRKDRGPVDPLLYLPRTIVPIRAPAASAESIDE
jgi:murein DD-endopeptidase MepM/ murein hydrolase activator NlpD